ncbi:hypothetical protein WMW72_30405 [Paenibacillus filicis]|uniref:Uncharacterized protein n=1 Tax=Paenibacillus filicis TaxID=669464 RepID=A0ABU9DTL5_9BACL
MNNIWGAAAGLLVVALFGLAVYADYDAGRKASLSKQLTVLEALFAEERQKLEGMPGRTEEEAEATVIQGRKVKKSGAEYMEIMKKLDPDNKAQFQNQLYSYIGAMMDGVGELRERAEREHDPAYAKQAEKLKQKIAYYKQAHGLYLKGERSVRQLRKELDLPAY